MRVILIRHGETDWNQEKIYRGRIDVTLNTNGVKQAGIIGSRLSELDIDAFYSSPLVRAYETAKIIASYHDKNVNVLDELTDIHFGDWQGLAKKDVVTKYPDIYETWENSPDRANIPGAETLEDVRKRLIDGFNKLLSVYQNGTVVVVSHGLTNKVALCVILGLDNSHFWKVKQDNGAINIFKYTEHGTKLFLMNDTSHLRSMNDIIGDMMILDDPLG
ncbi:MAG: histidine phosphatase family protein [Spirochaetota bacterium]|nr:MAG: histidine phosphatase family protein [Spirochaetota bacterium]